jgi:2-polyprenyl-3-methyl-5-hydroxy-6-metoxy-1,4-benzoquinol methylase
MLQEIKSKYLGPLANLVKSHPLSNPQKRWNEQYLNQEWDYLTGIKEFAHYSVVAGYATFFKKGGHVLDLGCGEGLLTQYLHPERWDSYMGIDVSDVAVEKAKQKNLNNTGFMAANITEYIPDRTFDIIIICEALQYIYKPSDLLKRYSKYLAPEGLFIISMYEDNHQTAWVNLSENYPPSIDETKVTNPQGMTWTVKVFPKFEGE